MTNDGWGKPKGWTTQQAVDKAVEKLNLTDTVKEVAKGWPKEFTPVQAADLVSPKQDITEFEMVETGPGGVAQSIEATQVETINDPKLLEFLLAREVKLYLDTKLFTTDGLQIGDLVIWDDGEFFCISHVPTLSKFMKAVPTEDDKEYTNEQLVRWCTFVQQAYLDDWAILRTLTPDNYMVKDIEITLAVSRIRDWCLSVEIE